MGRSCAGAGEGRGGGGGMGMGCEDGQEVGGVERRYAVAEEVGDGEEEEMGGMGKTFL